MLDLISIGDIKLDTFVLLNDASVSCQLKMPECQLCLEYGAKIDVRVVDSQIAGTAPNVATALARMGKKTAVLSNMGTDGTRILTFQKFKERGISTKLIRIVKGGTSAYSVVLNFKGERTILTSHNENVYKLPSPMQKSKWIFVGEMGTKYESFFRALANFIDKSKTQLAFNPGTIQIRNQKPVFFQLIKQAAVLFVNLEEAQKITNETTDEIHHLATKLWQLGSKQVIITDGKNGAYGFDGKQLFFAPLFPGERVEPTGAGDAFASGFLGAIGCLCTMQNALAWGSVNAASVVGSVGPTAGLLSQKEITSRLKKNKTYRIKEV